ncbi:Gem-associated protein 5 [Exaiptasia diaphana]|nr:Gem-associated protein 5 [Exaiptasia diaphana]
MYADSSFCGESTRDPPLEERQSDRQTDRAAGKRGMTGEGRGKNKVTCLCWSSVSSDLVLSADEKGTIIAWKHEKNVVYSFCPIQEYVFCISASCQSEQVAAVGYKNGLIIVVQLQEQGLRLVHRLRGHDSDIHSLSWCPVSIDHLQLGEACTMDSTVHVNMHLLHLHPPHQTTSTLNSPSLWNRSMYEL